jgi:hypothetical protein
VTLKGRVAIFASTASGAFVLAGVARAIDDFMSFRGQASPWIGAFELVVTIVALCAWACLFLITPQRPTGWRPPSPWRGRRAAPLLALGALAATAVAYALLGPQAKLGWHLAADLSPFAFALLIREQWWIADDAIDAWGTADPSSSNSI